MKISIVSSSTGQSLSINVVSNGHKFGALFAWKSPEGYWCHEIETVANDMLSILPVVNGQTRAKLVNAMEKAIA